MTVKFGLIGLGKISTRFAKVLNTVKDVELTAVASRDFERTKQFAKDFGAKKALAGYQDVIDDKDVDVIYIGLTHNFHYEIARKCLESHKAVLCEKPMVTNHKEAEKLVSLAKKNQTFLMEAMWTRCMPAFQKAREWVRSGKIGQVKLITANFCYHTEFDPNHRLYSKALAGGSLYDVGIYPIDFSIGIMGEHPQSVCGSALIAPNGVDESAAFSMKFASGALASLTCGFTVRAMEEAIIYGTSGRIIMENCYGPQACSRYDENLNLLEKFNEPVPDGFVYEIRHCADLVQHGKLESNLIPWQDTIFSAEIFDTLNRQWGITP
jgi:predicted dehydrogenase